MAAIAALRAGGRLGPGVATLVYLRTLFVSFCTVLGFVGLTVYFLSRGQDGGGVLPGAVGAALVVAVGVTGFVATRFYEAPLNGESDATLIVSYRTRFLARVALADAAALIGFVAFILTQNPAMYPLGLAFSIVGFLHLAPTAANIERDQQALIATGSSRSLLTALCIGPAGVVQSM